MQDDDEVEKGQEPTEFLESLGIDSHSLKTYTLYAG